MSYADFITLLFAFFATMYAMSSVDAKKLESVAQGLQAAFDDSARARRVAAGEGVLPERGKRLVPGPDTSKADVRSMVERDLAAELAANRLTLIEDQRGVTISIPEAGTFSVGHDELSATAQDLIGRVAGTLTNFGNPVRVEGHTDDVPIHTVRFISNWDLSAARASRVVEFLIQRGLQPARLSATGYAEFHPRVANDSDSARASNRRVDLVVLSADASLTEPGGGRTR